MYEQALEVRVAVHLSGAMVAVVRTKRSHLFDPFVDIANETRLGIVHVDCGGDMHRRDKNESLLNTALVDDARNIVGYVYVISLIRRIEPEVFGGRFQFVSMLQSELCP